MLLHFNGNLPLPLLDILTFPGGKQRGEKGVQVLGSHFLCGSNVLHFMAHLFIGNPVLVAALKRSSAGYLMPV